MITVAGQIVRVGERWELTMVNRPFVCLSRGPRWEFVPRRRQQVLIVSILATRDADMICDMGVWRPFILRPEWVAEARKL